jgi:uncharacterized repeat protein (TIGR03837 family)
MVTRSLMPLPLPQTTPPPPADFPRRWDIFCTVIDNFGDIGVCWRLARQLVAEYGCRVRLWVDDLASFARLCPEVQPTLLQQCCSGVEIHRWSAPFADAAPADVVIEAFACDLPGNYLAAMARREPAPRWINLEYLSAEDWVAKCHGLPSPHPKLPLIKHFFIPGFDLQSAGLLRERGLLAHHATVDFDAWWERVGGPPAPGQLKISLFAYENAATGTLLSAWASSHPVLCLVPESRVLGAVSTARGETLAAGDQFQDRALELRVLPFVRQEAYDDLLLACDLNFVRGEDSLVRALWAGKPFVWQLYRQEEDAHLVKLEAFLDRYTVGLSSLAKAALRHFWQGWNRERIEISTWHSFAAVLPELSAHTLRWRTKLAEQPDLASRLTDFCANRL